MNLYEYLSKYYNFNEGYKNGLVDTYNYIRKNVNRDVAIKMVKDVIKDDTKDLYYIIDK